MPEDTPAGGAVAVLSLDSGSALSKAQKRFNQLVEKLKARRAELQRWQAYQRFYQQQLGDIYQPMVVRLRQQRVEMVQVLDRALDGKELGKRERDKAQYLLNQLLAALLAVAEEPLLVRLHDKYSAASFAELQQERLHALRAAAREALDIDVAGYTGGESPAEFESWIEQQVRAAHAAAEAKTAGAQRPKRKTARSTKRDELRDQTAAGGTRAVREAYRKLVSELHPDREIDPAEQLRKTGLMQRVNRAYESGDLLALLELQLNIEQIDSAALAGLADERLRHYVHVLEEQARQLRAELAEHIEPFAVLLGESSGRKVTTDAVQRLLDQDIRELKTILRKIEMDLICFRDVRQLRESLGNYRAEPLDDDELDMPEDFQSVHRGSSKRRGSPMGRGPRMRHGGRR